MALYFNDKRVRINFNGHPYRLNIVTVEKDLQGESWLLDALNRQLIDGIDRYLVSNLGEPQLLKEAEGKLVQDSEEMFLTVTNG